MKGRYDIAECGDYYAQTPLPCSRTLWDYNTTESWANRLDRFKSKELRDKVFTIGDLEGFDGANISGTDEELLMGLARWCEGIDEFGTLVWMVSSLE